MPPCLALGIKGAGLGVKSTMIPERGSCCSSPLQEMGQMRRTNCDIDRMTLALSLTLSFLFIKEKTSTENSRPTSSQRDSCRSAIVSGSVPHNTKVFPLSC